MTLYSVSFTTQKLVKSYDAKGKIVSETKLDTPITLTALPYATAMSYAKAENFAIVEYVMDDRRRPRSTGRDESVGNGTKSRRYAEARESAPVSPASAASSSLRKAAETGDLSRAISGGA